MLQKKYNIIFSLGSSCACAIYMRKTNLRTYASPFDWLIHADFSARIQFIVHNFENFLNIEDLVPIPPPPGNKKSNTIANIGNTRTNLYFYHDFPKDQPLEQSYPAIKEKYDRRIQRFYKLIKERKKVLMIWFAHDWRTDNQTIVHQWQKLCAVLEKQMDLLVIENNSKMPYGKIEKTELAPNILRYDLHTSTLDDKGIPTTLGDEEHCLPIFRQFRLNDSLKNKIFQNIWRFLPRILCCVVPVKKWRHKIRHYFKWS